MFNFLKASQVSLPCSFFSCSRRTCSGRTLSLHAKGRLTRRVTSSPWSTLRNSTHSLGFTDYSHDRCDIVFAITLAVCLLVPLDLGPLALGPVDLGDIPTTRTWLKASYFLRNCKNTGRIESFREFQNFFLLLTKVLLCVC